MKLKSLVNIPFIHKTTGNLDIEIEELNLDSRKISKNGLFFCVAGENHDSHNYAKQAVSNGNVALVVDHILSDIDVPQILVSNSRSAMAYIAAKFHGDPQKYMKFVAITGTKGKTTTSYMCKSIFEAAGYKVGLIGTTGNMIGNKRHDNKLTTPDPIDLYKILETMHNENVEIVVMEASAHAIDMHRLDGLEFEVACYTNLSQDHLDYFGDMDTYFQAKKKLFTSGQVQNAVLNADEDTCKLIVDEITIPHVFFGIGANADVYARNIEVKESGASFNIHLGNVENMDINMKMTGNFNVYNALCAASAAMVMGVDYKYIKEGLENVASVPGRIELLVTNTPYKVILDYSHSPDSLDNILRTVREFTKKRVIVVFGCGGDRDHTKRPVMGAIAGRLADISIITSDNPRNENPMQIIDSIVMGISKQNCNYKVIEDRREAIKYALSIGQEGDVIILAGKGHETYQERMGVKYPFDEKIIVKELLEEISEGVKND